MFKRTLVSRLITEETLALTVITTKLLPLYKCGVPERPPIFARPL